MGRLVRIGYYVVSTALMAPAVAVSGVLTIGYRLAGCRADTQDDIDLRDRMLAADIDLRDRVRDADIIDLRKPQPTN
jgi:hypothetical protein